MQKFEFERSVQAHEIDELNHVNNVVYLQWVQDVAGAHWNVLTKDDAESKQYIWVVIRHEIDYIGQAVLGDLVTFKTWVGKTGGVKSIRHVEIYVKDKCIARAQTTWCMLDSTTKRPARISDSLLAVMQPQE